MLLVVAIREWLKLAEPNSLCVLNILGQFKRFRFRCCLSQHRACVLAALLLKLPAYAEWAAVADEEGNETVLHPAAYM